MEELTLVEVVWWDAACEFHQISLEEAKGLSPILRKNVGYLLSKDKEKLNMSFGIISDTVYDTVLTIPIKIVKSITKK